MGSPRAKRKGYFELKREKQGAVTYKTDRENEISHRQRFRSWQVRVQSAVFAVSTNMAAIIKTNARDKLYTTNYFIIDNNTFNYTAFTSLAVLGALRYLY